MSEPLVRRGIKALRPYISGKNPVEPGVIKLASNENPLGPSPKALKAMSAAFKSLPIYPDQHSTKLRRALARKLGLKEENFIIGNGSDEVMQMIAATYLSAGDEVLIPKNVFSTYEFVTILFDGVSKFVELKDFRQDPDEFVKSATLKTKLVFLCNPANPTGTYLTQSQLDDFIRRVPPNVMVIIDEAYCEFHEAPDFPDGTKYLDRENVVVLRTFSKLYGLAGIRVGYGLAHPNTIKYLAMTKLPFNVNRLAEVGAIAALEDEKHVKETLKINREEKKYLYPELEKLGLSFIKTEANFIFIDLKRSADEIFLKLMSEKIIIRPLTSFGFPQAIRVSVGTKQQNEKFIGALKKVLSY